METEAELIDLFDKLCGLVEIYIGVGDSDLKANLKKEIEQLLDLIKTKL
jgi:hypothetical protein